MQQNFIKTTEESGQNDIQDKQNQILDLDSEVAKHQKHVEDLLSGVKTKEDEATNYGNASETLRKLGKFLGKIQSKKSTTSDTLSFFNENSVCPTCTQNIQEEFRVNKTVQLQQSVAKFDDNLKEVESKNSLHCKGRLLNSRMRFLKQTFRFLNLTNYGQDWNVKFKLLPTESRTEILNMRS